MERASRVLKNTRLAQCLTPEDLAQAAFRAAVGKRLAGKVRPAALAGSRLFVEVSDETWRSQLFTLRSQILKKMEQFIGPGTVSGLEFRVAPPRRMPARAQEPVRGADDERIEDPILSLIYRDARKRATS